MAASSLPAHSTLVSLRCGHVIAWNIFHIGVIFYRLAHSGLLQTTGVGQLMLYIHGNFECEHLTLPMDEFDKLP